MNRRACLAALLCVLWVPARWAGAHALSVAHLDIATAGDGRARVELDLALRDLALTLPLDADHDERVRWGELQAIRAPLEAMVLRRLEVATDRGRCALRPVELATRDYDDGAYATLVLDARCPAGPGLRVSYRLLFDRDPRHRALVTVRGEAGVATAIASAGAPVVRLGSPATPFAGFLREGVRHILAGYDHLAFLLSLLLPAALLRRDRAWQAAPSLRGSLGQVLGIVTAFTVAHSITLGLAALGWVVPASRPVEAAIAASVLLAALNNVWPVVVRRLWLVGFGFGLVHGFGFAGALAELGLPANDRLAALLGFNLGVESGQLLVVACVLPLLFALRRPRWYARVAMPLGSLAIAVLAGGWLLQRLGG